MKHLEYERRLNHMRLNQSELEELMLPYRQHFHDAIYAGCEEAGKSDNLNILAPNKKAFFSHLVRSVTYDYLKANPLDGFTLDDDAHKLNQAVVLTHESGLELRIMRLASFTPSINSPIHGINEALATSLTIPQLDLQLQSPGVAAISWETPAFHNGAPVGEIPLTFIRAVEGTKLREGRADVAFSLYGTSTLIPECSFNPDVADSTFTFENENVQQL